MSGTDRVAEVASRHAEFTAVLNVQGDEPGIAPDTVDAVAAALADPAVDIATAVSPVWTIATDLDNPNVVKVGADALPARALYFSRARDPFPRDASRAPPHLLPASRDLRLSARRPVCA